MDKTFILIIIKGQNFKNAKVVLSLLFSVQKFIMFNISTKFHENTFDSFKVMMRTQFSN